MVLNILFSGPADYQHSSAIQYFFEIMATYFPNPFCSF